jgi:IS1 family transposase/lambda repressor-like predicted transcriptional regulator
MVSMNRLDTKSRARIVAALVEGNSIRATVRMTGVSKNTISNLLVDLGEACADYMDRTLVNLPCKRVQCDEIWSFCHSKQKNVPKEHEGEFGYGDIWTWTAICSDTKLVLSVLVGRRDLECARLFMNDVASRLKHRVQLSTDGHFNYPLAVDTAFWSEVDYGVVIKKFGREGSNKNPETRYSPAVCTSIEKRVIVGEPDEAHISTSHVERQNLTMRMGMRRFTRLTNGFSKKAHNHYCAIVLHFMHYNFARVHQTLRVTPAMEAGVAKHVWSIEEIVGLLEERENAQSENRAALKSN